MEECATHKLPFSQSRNIFIGKRRDVVRLCLGEDPILIDEVFSFPWGILIPILEIKRKRILHLLLVFFA